MSVRKRTVQRTPDLGIKIRMVKDVAPVADCCVPEIGVARWYNPATGAYDLETVVAVLSDGSAIGAALFVAQVAGVLCDATVTWVTAWVPVSGWQSPQVGTPGRGLAVALSGNLTYYPGALTATATVTTRDGITKHLPPIYLVITEEVYGCC